MHLEDPSSRPWPLTSATGSVISFVDKLLPGTAAGAALHQSGATQGKVSQAEISHSGEMRVRTIKKKKKININVRSFVVEIRG